MSILLKIYTIKTQYGIFLEHLRKKENKGIYYSSISIIITERNHNHSKAYTHMLGHKSLDDYVSFIVVQNLEMEKKDGFQ
jgi:hypothetical protein